MEGLFPMFIRWSITVVCPKLSWKISENSSNVCKSLSLSPLDSLEFMAVCNSEWACGDISAVGRSLQRDITRWIVRRIGSTICWL